MWAQEAKPGRRWVGRLPFQGDLLESLEAFAAAKQVDAGWINVIGAVEKAVIGFYDQKKKQYDHLEFDQELEIVSCMGNLSLRQGRPVAHLHITLGDSRGRIYGGHLVRGTVVVLRENFICRNSSASSSSGGLIKKRDSLSGRSTAGGLRNEVCM